MNKKIAYWSVTVAVSGFLFGFDTAVISGADQPLQKLWGSNDLFHGLFIMSSALWGTVIGALIIAVIQYGLVFIDVEPFWQFVAVGVVIIAMRRWSDVTVNAPITRWSSTTCSLRSAGASGL